MKRSEIKNKAKEMIKGNLWYILTVYLVMWGISIFVELANGLLSFAPFIQILVSIAGIIITASLSVSLANYILKFTRGEKIK